jgi:hypothetical protein
VSDDFDPAAYLAEKRAAAAAEPDFDPVAYLAEKRGAKAAPNVGVAETLLNSTGKALPGGHVLSNALTALGLSALGPKAGARLSPQAAAELNMPQEAAQPGYLENYRAARDRLAERTEAGSQQNKWASGIGTTLGTALSLAAPLPKVTVGGGVTGRILSNALTAGSYGALNGVLNGRADLTKGEGGQALKDAVGVEGLQRAAEDWKAGNKGRAALDVMGAGGLGGAVTGGALGAGMEGIRAVASPLAGALKSMAINQGRRVLTNGSGTLSSRMPVSPEAVEEAIRGGAIKPFGNTEGAAQRLGSLVEQVDEKRQGIISALEAKGVRGPDARKVADQLMATGAGMERQTMNNALPQEYLSQAENLLGKAGQEGELGLTQAENLKRSLQKQARYGRPEDTEINNVRKEIASTMRQANEDAISQAAQASPKDAQLQQLAADFGPVKQQEGRLLEALAAAERGARAGANRGHFGLKQTLHAGAAIASGHGALAVPAAAASHFLQNRAPSAVASYGLSLADALSRSPGQGGRTGQLAELLMGALGPPPLMTPAMAAAQPPTREQQLAQALRGDTNL